ncbi:hypothetical protein EYE40_03130 [Glaciihabitans arcticus]|uniref:Uncharacterized protein n=1 Tax=Glaciihabitans arcticus TaxID=2668039 RepID=A0A4Q9GP04_9MICO|nr:hypothetical protein [Glaciihabitans arcticus]TBN56471.1 hypothetical protein EYE40_03130 [Glaciihabitans arcticus]
MFGKKVVTPTDRRYESARLYIDEVSKHLALISARRESMNNRAGLLVASASVSAGFATVDSPSGWEVTALVLTTIAAILGIVALWPTKTDVVSIELVRDTVLPNANAASLTELGDTWFVMVPDAARRLKIRAYVVASGFVLLGLSLVSGVSNALQVQITIGGCNG